MECLYLSDKTVYRGLKRPEKEFSLEKKRICRRKPPEPLQINALEVSLKILLICIYIKGERDREPLHSHRGKGVSQPFLCWGLQQ